MKTKDLIMYAAIAGGAYALYWYINNYGPSGAVAVAGGPGSYWASWFGTTATTPVVTAGTTTTSTSVDTTPATTTTTAPATTASGTVSTQQMATQQQLQAINYLLSPQDQRTFASMAPTLTYAQAASMLANAQACVTGTTYSLSDGLCSTPKATPIQTVAASGGTAAQDTPNRRGTEGLGMIMPAPSTVTQANSGVGLGGIDLGALPKKSPWGKMPNRYTN
jgi:hypothetical protein